MARLSIIVVERDRDRALKIVDGLIASGDHLVTVLAEEVSLARRIADQKPDVVLIDVANPWRDVLEELALVSGPLERPVAMFVDRSDEQMTRTAIEAGVSAYVVDGLQPDRIKPILDAAIARFHMFQKMRAELAATRAALVDRKIIDRAKAILMKARGIDEEAACPAAQDPDGPETPHGRHRAATGHGGGSVVVNHDMLRLGYVPLIDAAPLIIAQEIGFAAEEGLTLDLIRLQSWAQARDMLGTGGIDAAHMLAPLPIAQALGLGPAYPALDLVMVLSQGGQAIAVNAGLERALRSIGHDFAFDDPAAARDALARVAGDRLRVGVPFPFSTHALLVRHWLKASPLFARLTIRTVPPPRMAEALATGEVDAFCVGEPWASHAVETASGALLLPGRSIWAVPPEKGLVLTRDFAERRAELTGRLMRAVWRACRWLDRAENRGAAAEIVSRPDYLNLPPELSERGLVSRLHISAQGETRVSPDFIRFHAGGTNFPWRSLADLFAGDMVALHRLDPEPVMARRTAAFRTDLYRQHLRSAGADLPGASSRIEGAVIHPTAVASEQGQMILCPDAFFDGTTFDPAFASG